MLRVHSVPSIACLLGLAFALHISTIHVVVAAPLSASSRLVGHRPGPMDVAMAKLKEENSALVCLVCSRSVTRRKLEELLQELVSHNTASTTDNNKATLAVIQTTESLIDHIAFAATASDGNVVFVPDPVDLQRGEGLFDQLAPLMECVRKDRLRRRAFDDDEGTTESSSVNSGETTLWIVVEDGNFDLARSQLESAAESVMTNLVSNDDEKKSDIERPVALLTDVFDRVRYVTPGQLRADLAAASSISMGDLIISLPSLAEIVRSNGIMPELEAENLAAARRLGPIQRIKLAQALEQVQQVCQSDEDESSYKFVPNFGDLADAAMKRALEEFEQEVADAPTLLQSAIGKDCKGDLLQSLDTDLGRVFDSQLDLAEKVAFDMFRKELSKLIVTPNLAADMHDKAGKSVAAFADLTRKLIAQRSSWSAQAAKTKYRRRLQEYVSNRLLTAQAKGQFRPLPRKGVTLAFHWLLPKPFGNDFRQEPWLVHATDDMVYIPPDKVTTVQPDEAATGDWRSQIVPSPTGNDMIYLQ